MKSLVFLGLLVFLTGESLADSIFLTAADFDLTADDNQGATYYRLTYLQSQNDSTYNQFVSPVHLPQGAQITSIVVRYWDSVSGYIHVLMRRINMYTNTSQTMFDWSSSGETTAWQGHKITGLTYWTVDNSGYGYQLIINFSQSTTELALEGIRINYNMP